MYVIYQSISKTTAVTVIIAMQKAHKPYKRFEIIAELSNNDNIRGINCIMRCFSLRALSSAAA